MEDVQTFIELLQLCHCSPVIGWNSGAKNQHLVRLILGHSAIRLLFVDPDHVDPFTFLNNLRPESTAPKVLVFSCFQILHVCTASPSIMKHSTTVASLSLPRCRRYSHEDMAFFFPFMGMLSRDAKASFSGCPN